MRNLIITAVTASALGAAAALAWNEYAARPSRSQPVEDPVVSANAFDTNAPLQDRIAALEQAVSIERQARQLLQEEVIVLSDALAGAAPGVAADDPTPAAAGSAASARAASRSGSRRGRFADPAVRRERLVDNGFTPAEAEQILRRESELQMEALQARYEAQRSGEPFAFGSSTSKLRAELGDEAYGRYREASGRPTAVTVSTIYESSPALAAGLRPGDQILRYDGQRVFSMDEIVGLTLEGAAGENVLLDVERDGQLMQMTIPRGPLGVSGGRRFRR